MTSIPSSIGKIPSLADYLSTNGNGAKTSASGSIGSAAIPSLAAYMDASETQDGDTVSLSSTAQLLMAQGASAAPTGDADGGKAAKAGALDFIKQFFGDSGADLSKLSDEAKTLLKGIGDIMDSMTSITQDKTMDSMTARYGQGQRKSFTLQGDNQRFSATVQYDAGKPVSITLTQIKGTTVNNAKLLIGRDSTGQPVSIDLDRSQSQYNSFGGKTGATDTATLSLPLYA